MSAIETNAAVQSSGDLETRSSAMESWARLTGVIAAAWRWVQLRSEKSRSRLTLSEFTDSQLDDIGVTRAEARRETCRPFWD